MKLRARHDPIRYPEASGHLYARHRENARAICSAPRLTDAICTAHPWELPRCDYLQRGGKVRPDQG